MKYREGKPRDHTVYDHNSLRSYEDCEEGYHELVLIPDHNTEAMEEGKPEA